MDRKRVALAGLLVLLLLALLYGYRQSPRQERVGSQGAPTQRAAVIGKKDSDRGGATTLPALRRDLLQRQPESYPGVKQNLFRSSTWGAAVKTEPVVTVVPEPVVVVPPPVVESPPVEPTPEQVVKRELARLKFLGFLKKGEERTVFLASAGEIFLVHKGDRFGRGKEFLVTYLSPTVMTVEQAGVGEIVIPLVEQTPLAPSSIGGPREERVQASPPEPTREGENRVVPGGLRGPLLRTQVETGANEE